MPSTAGVGKRAQQIQGVFGPTVSLQNIGPDDVYLGSDSSVSPDNGWLLPARGMGTWEGGTQLWACSVGSSQLRLADSSLTFFTPGPDHVTIDGGTVNIGNASIPISGSVDIASGNVTANISGPVSISGSTVNVGNAVALSNSNRFLIVGQAIPVVANSVVRSFSPNGGAIGGIPSSIATGGNIQSIGFQVFGNTAASPQNAVAKVTVAWLDTNGNALSSDVAGYWVDGAIDWTLPAKSQYFQIQVANLNNGFSLNSVNVSVSNTPQARSYYSDPGLNGFSYVNVGSAIQSVQYPGGPYGVALFDATSPTADAGYSQIMVPSRSGKCTIKTTISELTTSTVEVKVGGVGWPITAASATVWLNDAGVGTSHGEIVIPETPVMIQVRSTVTSGSAKRYFGALSWDS